MSETIPFIISIGSGTVEHIANCENKAIEWGGKNISELEMHFGGSSVNHSMRLLSSGINTIPISSIGQDEIGRAIQSVLHDTAVKSHIHESVVATMTTNESNDYLIENMRSSRTFIIIHNDDRTIFVQKPKNVGYFFNHLCQRLNRITSNFGKPQAIMIGHIYSDAATIDTPINPATSDDNRGACTKYLIDHFADNTLVFANLGKSQLELGLQFWQDYLPRINLIQFNVKEARGFFSHCNNLLDIINEIRHREINAVITLDKVGAIGIHKDDKQQVIVAWPLVHAEKVIDTTGAGDAFGAGLVAHLHGPSSQHSKPGQFSFTDFACAIEKACTWSAIACQSVGGASNCPDRHAIDNYQSLKQNQEYRPVEICQDDDLAELLQQIDDDVNT